MLGSTSSFALTSAKRRNLRTRLLRALNVADVQSTFCINDCTCVTNEKLHFNILPSWDWKMLDVSWSVTMH